MERTQYGQDYRPRYAIGARVIVGAGLSAERVDTIVGRRVYRDRNHSRGDTFYRFADASGAWEWNVQPTTERVAPETALDRIVRAFADRLSYVQLTTTRQLDGSWSVAIHLEVRHAPADGAVERVDITAEADAARTVETIGAWFYRIGDAAAIAVDALGSAIVDAYNASMTSETANA